LRIHFPKFFGYGPRRSPKSARVAATLAYVAGGFLVVGSAYIHFHLWDEAFGYRHISIIGPLFLAQAIGGLVLGILIIVVRRVWVAVAGIGFAASTLIGFLLSADLAKGLFNFKESWAAPYAGEAFAIEIAITVVLALAGALCLAASASSRAGDRAPGAQVSARKPAKRSPSGTGAPVESSTRT
jgi:hypothetical protein